MKFFLVYHGLLPGSGNKPKPDVVRDIRDKFHPQLDHLWKVNATLRRLRQAAIVPKGDNVGLAVSDTPFYEGRDVDAYPAREDEVDLCAPIDQSGKLYIPLVRGSLQLNCHLSITFLRQEDPGSLVLQGGDLDNRIKTLFDALRMPDPFVQTSYPQAQNPTYCLLESDSLISGFDIRTSRLLFPSSDNHHHEVHLSIEVAIDVLKVGEWNIPLIGN